MVLGSKQISYHQTAIKHYFNRNIGVKDNDEGNPYLLEVEEVIITCDSAPLEIVASTRYSLLLSSSCE